jgi:hypothetical protein
MLLNVLRIKEVAERISERSKEILKGNFEYPLLDDVCFSFVF